MPFFQKLLHSVRPNNNTPLDMTVDRMPAEGDLILALFEIQPGVPEYHWVIYAHRGTGTGTQDDVSGTKFHVTGVVGISDSWSYKMSPFTLVTSYSITTAKVIGNITGRSSLDALDAIFAAIPLGVVPAIDGCREAAFSCGVWVREALRRLHARRIINCPDVDALEREMLALAAKSFADRLGAEEELKVVIN